MAQRRGQHLLLAGQVLSRSRPDQGQKHFVRSGSFGVTLGTLGLLDKTILLVAAIFCLTSHQWGKGVSGTRAVGYCHFYHSIELRQRMFTTL